MFEIQKKLITPDVAREYLQRNYEYQRRLNPKKVRFLADEIRLGRFEPSSPIEFVHGPNQFMRLINGQHTLNAIIESDTAVELPVIFRQVKDEHETALAFSRVDVGLKRSASDSLQPFGLLGETGISKTDAGRILSAALWIDNRFHGKELFRDIAIEDKMELVKEWMPSAEMVFYFIQYPDNPSIHQKIKNRAVLSVALITAKHQPGRAGEFWRQVALGDGLRVGDPRKTLREKLLNTSLGGGKEGTSNQVTASYLSRFTATAWNAFYDGKPKHFIRVTSNSSPVVIKGTPYR